METVARPLKKNKARSAEPRQAAKKAATKGKPSTDMAAITAMSADDWKFVRSLVEEYGWDEFLMIEKANRNELRSRGLLAKV
jgi:hypothetical protein